TFKFWQIEIGARAAGQELLCVMKEEKPKIHEARRRRLPVHQDMFLSKMPSPRAHHQYGGSFHELVVLTLFVCELDGSTHGISKIDLAGEGVFPCWRV